MHKVQFMVRHTSGGELIQEFLVTGETKAHEGKTPAQIATAIEAWIAGIAAQMGNDVQMEVTAMNVHQKEAPKDDQVIPEVKALLCATEALMTVASKFFGIGGEPTVGEQTA